MADRKHEIVYIAENKYLFIKEIRVRIAKRAIVIVLQCNKTKTMSENDFIGVFRKSVIVQVKAI